MKEKSNQPLLAKEVMSCTYIIPSLLPISAHTSTLKALDFKVLMKQSCFLPIFLCFRRKKRLAASRKVVSIGHSCLFLNILEYSKILDLQPVRPKPVYSLAFTI